MKIKRLLGIFGFIYVGLSLFFAPSIEHETIIDGFSALEKISENETEQEVEKINQMILTLFLQGKEIARLNMISLGVIFVLSIFLTKENGKPEPAD